MNLRFRALLLVAAFLIAPFTFAQASLPEEKVVPVFGQNIHYFEAGQGSAVILLHGLGAVKEIWLGDIDGLSAKYHVYAIDQVGFGHSDKPLLDYKVATFSEFLYGFMQSQHLTKATLVGNSLGGWVALDFATQHPEMLDKLVLVNSAGITWPGRVSPVNLNPATLAATRKLLETLFYNKKIVTDALVQQVFADHMKNNDGYTIRRTMEGFGIENQFEDAKLASFHTPTLLVWGRDDELLPVGYGEKLRDALPGSKMVVLDQCGHVPPMEKPAEFTQAVLDFLAK